MRNIAWRLASLAAVAALGCAGGTDSLSTPSTPSLADGGTTPPSSLASDVSLGNTQFSGTNVQEALGIFTVNVDLETLTGTTALKEKRTGQEGELFLLDVSSFLAPTDFQLLSVGLTAGTVDITYSTSHPFPAPSDLCGAATAGNRADLAVTGRVLWLLDGNDGNTYFAGDGDYEANTGLVTNADGYFQPGGMLDTTGLDTNTFPYQLLVDETRDNRVGVSNSGNMHGNYPGTTSWTQANFVAGITGYGIWAQGQTSTNTLSLSLPLLTAGSTFTTDVAIVVKYGDPRVGTTGPEKRGNRLPCGTNEATSNPRSMIYRMPNAALDVETVFGANDTGGLQEGVPGSTTVSARVRDWDGEAVEAAQFCLATETDTSLISLDTGGAPIVDVDIADMAETGAVLTPGGGTGDAGDEYVYTGLVSGTPTAPFGEYGGMVRATDAFDTNAPATDNCHFNLSAIGDPPLTAHFEGATLQYFTTDVLPPCDAPTGDWTISPNPIVNGNTTNVVITNLTIDAGDTMFDVYVDWGTGGGLVLVGNDVLYTGPGPYNFASPAYNLANPAVAETKTLAISVNSVNCPIDAPLNNVGGTTLTINPCGQAAFVAANRTPGWTGSQGSWCWNCTFGAFPKDIVAIPGSSPKLGGAFVSGFVAYAASIQDFQLGYGNAGNFITPYTNINFTAEPLVLESDVTGRILWVQTAVGNSAALNSPAYTYANSTNLVRYLNVGLGAAAQTGQFDAGAGVRVVAMATALDQDVWIVTNNNILRKFNFSAGSYSEVAAAQIDLKAAPFNLTLTGAGAGDHKIFDIIYDDYAEAILVASNTLEAAPSNIYVTRINCTGTKPSLPAGNPIVLNIGTNATQTGTYGMTIDKFDAAGVSIGSGMSGQIIVLRGQSGSTLGRTIDIELNTDASWTGPNGFAGGRCTVLDGNQVMSPYTGGVDAIGYQGTGGAGFPANWI